MKSLFAMLTILCMVVFATSQPWEVVGYEHFSEAEVFDIAMTTVGTVPIVAFCDVTYDNKISVMYYVDYDNSWYYVGNPGVSDTVANYPSLTMNGDDLFLAYMDGAYSNRATVLYWNFESWESVGDYGGASTGRAEYISLSYSPYYNTLFIGYKDGAVDGRATVRVFYEYGPSKQATATSHKQTTTSNKQAQSLWTRAPNRNQQTTGQKVNLRKSFSTNKLKQIQQLTDSAREHRLASPTTSSNISLSKQPTMPTTSPTTRPSTNSKSLPKISGYWELVGNQGFTSEEVNYVSLGLDSNGNIYLACMDAANNYRASVYQYYWETGKGWNTLGDPGFSIGSASYISLTISADDVLYVGYRDGGNGNYASVRYFDWNNYQWNILGSEGLSDCPVKYVNLSTLNYYPYYPCIVYCDQNNNNVATARQWNGSYWETIGDYNISNYMAAYTVIRFDSSGTVLVAYKDFIIPDKQTKDYNDGITVKKNSVYTIIELLEFKGISQNGAVAITWKTGSETDTLGFYICRSQNINGPYIRVNSAIIPSTGSPTSGADYSYQDQPSQSGEYIYCLESVDTNNRSTYHPPISVIHNLK